MDQSQSDGHLVKNKSSQCEFHVTQIPKYYCPHRDCRTHLCGHCMHQHPKEHLPNITTIEDVKSQTFDLIKKETVGRLDKFFNPILKSRLMDDLFKETFGNLMHQNTSIDLDEEDIADILADTLQKKYLEKGIVMGKRIEEETSVEFAKAELIAFDYEYEDDKEENDQNHERNMREFCKSSAEFYCKDELGSFYVESKGQIIFWNPKDQTLLCKDLTNSKNKSKKYKISSPFQFLTVLEFGGDLLFFVASDDKLIVYSIPEENQGDPEDLEDLPPLKLCQEYHLQEKITFLASDHAHHLFLATEGSKADIYALKSQNNESELHRTFSFGSFDLPKKVAFDRVNNLLFILFDDNLKIYKYNAILATSFHLITKIKTMAFIWHQATQRLLLPGLKELYQFGKGKFRLLRRIPGETKPIGLTHQGILCAYNSAKLFLLSQKNPKDHKSLMIPSGKSEIKYVQQESYERFGYHHHFHFYQDVEPRTGDLYSGFKTVRLVSETPGHLLIFADIESSQSASQKVGYDHWQPFGGTIYAQRLLRYNIDNQREFKIMQQDDKERDDGEEE